MSLDLNEKTNKNNYYVKNKDLLVEIEKLQQTNQFSDTLGKYIIQIVNGLSHRPNFNGYTYIEDMKSEAHVAIIKGLRNFNLEKSNNPFAYITQIAWNAFIAFIGNEKKKSKTKKRLFDLKEIIQEDDSLCAINYSYYCEIEIFDVEEEGPVVSQDDLEICEEE